MDEPGEETRKRGWKKATSSPKDKTGNIYDHDVVLQTSGPHAEALYNQEADRELSSCSTSYFQEE